MTLYSVVEKPANHCTRVGLSFSFSTLTRINLLTLLNLIGIRQEMITEKNGDVSPREIADLRESVRWDRNEEAYPEV